MKIEKTRVGVLKQAIALIDEEGEKRVKRARNEDQYIGFRFSAHEQSNGLAYASFILSKMLSDLENEPEVTRSPQGTGQGRDWRSGLIIKGSYTARLLAAAGDEYKAAREFAALIESEKMESVRNQLAVMVVGGLLIRRQEPGLSPRNRLAWTYAITEMGVAALAAV